MSLRPEEVTHFHDEGYLVLDGLLPPDRLGHYVALFDEILHAGNAAAPGTPHLTYEKDAAGNEIPGLLHKVQGVCVYDARVLELAREPVIVDRVQDLIGAELDCFGTKFFPKLAGYGTSTKWHQDNYYFGTDTDRIVSCGIYLEATDRENGCLRVIPGTHRDRKILDHKPIPGRHGSWVDVDESAAVDVVCSAGTVVLFSANILHGAYDNTSERTRYSTAWHYLPKDLALKHFGDAEAEDRHIVARR